MARGMCRSPFLIKNRHTYTSSGHKRKREEEGDTTLENNGGEQSLNTRKRSKAAEYENEDKVIMRVLLKKVEELKL